MQQSNEITNRKRKALMIMPLLVLPFVILCFWALGGGKDGQQEIPVRSTGLNSLLPAAQLDNKPMDKLSMYKQAEKDSIARKEADRYDPFAQWMPDNTHPDIPGQGDHYPSHIVENPFSPGAATGNTYGNKEKQRQAQDINEAKVRERLTELEKVLASHPADSLPTASSDLLAKSGLDPEIDQVNTRMQDISVENDQQDPELAQMNAMLSKILDIQHPSLVRERLKAASEKEKGKVFPVQTKPDQEIINDLLPPVSTVRPDTVLHFTGDSLTFLPITTLPPNQFYEWNDGTEESTINNAIAAVVHETQTLVTGATLKLRLTQDVFIQGQLIPAGTFVFGESTLSGERLQCSISTIHYKDALFPVSLTVFDAKDGLPGLHVPGAISRDVAKQGTDEAIQSLQLATLDPNIGTQAAAAGIETAKNFLSKKTKLIKVTAKAGHPVLLLDSRQQQ